MATKGVWIALLGIVSALVASIVLFGPTVTGMVTGPCASWCQYYQDQYTKMGQPDYICTSYKSHCGGCGFCGGGGSDDVSVFKIASVNGDASRGGSSVSVRPGDQLTYSILSRAAGTTIWTTSPAGGCGAGTYSGGPASGAIANCQAGYTYTGEFLDSAGVSKGKITVVVAGAVPAVCANECTSGATRCSGSYQETCGNYDADACTEWGRSTSCALGCDGPGCQLASDLYMFTISDQASPSDVLLAINANKEIQRAFGSSRNLDHTRLFGAVDARNPPLPLLIVIYNNQTVFVTRSDAPKAVAALQQQLMTWFQKQGVTTKAITQSQVTSADETALFKKSCVEDCSFAPYCSGHNLVQCKDLEGDGCKESVADQCSVACVGGACVQSVCGQTNDFLYATLREGETSNFEINGVALEITSVYADARSAKFKVNGEVGESQYACTSYRFSGGYEIIPAEIKVMPPDAGTERQTVNFMISWRNLSAPSTWCRDTDGGINFEVYGTATQSNGWQSNDACGSYVNGTTSNQLFEAYCNGTTLATQVYYCPKGCAFGACLNGTTPEIRCEDSDNSEDGIGNDVYNAGVVTVTQGGDAQRFRDTCQSETLNETWNGSMVLEYRCLGPQYPKKTMADAVAWVRADCRYGCLDGACNFGPSCQDECNPNALACVNGGTQLCGQFDADACLDAGPIVNCSRACADAKCLANLPNLVISDLQWFVVDIPERDQQAEPALRGMKGISFRVVMTNKGTGPAYPQIMKTASAGLLGIPLAIEGPYSAYTQANFYTEGRPEVILMPGQSYTAEWGESFVFDPVKGVSGTFKATADYSRAAVNSNVIIESNENDNTLSRYISVAPTPTCANECTAGQKQCYGPYVQTCGNYDADSCTEWGANQYCQSGCIDSMCKSSANACASWCSTYVSRYAQFGFTWSRMCGSYTQYCGGCSQCG
jgi:hypothetical protein